MRLWCTRCQEVHEFTDRGAERLVYALVAMTKEPTISGRSICLRRLLLRATEGPHSGFVNSCLERRKGRGSTRVS